MSSRKLLGRVNGRGRQQLHSLSQFENALKEAHKDLHRFSKLERTFDFDSFFETMPHKLEKGIQEAFEIELRLGLQGQVMMRSKPRMSNHVEFNPWTQYWPPPRECWIRDRQPLLPPFDGIPDLCPLQLWPKYARVSADLRAYYNDPVWCTDLAAKYEMIGLLRQWGDDPTRSRWSRPSWPDWDDDMPPSAGPRTNVVPRVKRRRRDPLVRAPYDRIGAILCPPAPRRRARGRGARGRGRGARGRGARGRGRGARGRGARGRGRGARGRGRGVRGARGRGRGARGRGRGRGVRGRGRRDGRGGRGAPGRTRGGRGTRVSDSSSVSDYSSESDSSSVSIEDGMTLNELMERNRVRDGVERGRGGKRKRDSPTSEDEFVLSDEQPVQTFPDNRKFPDYLNRRVDVPSSYFNQMTDTMYRGTCSKWGKYKSTSGDQLLGYYVVYDVGDSYWMLEKDVHSYVLSE